MRTSQETMVRGRKGGRTRGPGRLVALFAAAAAGALSSIAFALPAAANHSWNGYHWRSGDAAVEVTFVDSLSPRARNQGFAPAVLADWKVTGAVFPTRALGDNDRSLRTHCALATGAIRICDADYGEGWFGHTDLVIDEGHIVGGRIRINSRWGTDASYRRFVLCHEVGHALGLGHRHSGRSCLNGGRRPDQHDRDMLKKMYGHTDEAATPEPGCSDLLCGVSASSPAAPSDTTGSSVFDQSGGAFKFIPGPLFPNVVLVDEIKRTSPRTQSGSIPVRLRHSVLA